MLTRTLMTSELLIDAAAPRRWHGRLAAALSAAGVACVVRSVQTHSRPPHPPALDWLLLLDRTLHGSGEHALDPAALPARDRGTFDIVADTVIDLTGMINGRTSRRHLVPLFDGSPGEGALWSALLDGRAPRLDLYDQKAHVIIPIGLPALEAPHQLMVSADHVIARLVEGIERAVRLGLRGIPASGSAPQAPHLPPTQSISALAEILTVKAKRVLERRLHQAPQWCVAWRTTADLDTDLPSGAITPTEWTFLPDDRQRYYADPFIACEGERRFLFVEEFPYATQRGVISAFEIGADGRALTTPKPVLERPFHLSYPQIFIDGGVTYMLPEAAASGKLTLYRAERFPDRWTEVADLLDARVHDATLFRTHHGYWLFAATEGHGGSSWDALSLYHAPALLGPWMPHAMNPVIVDAGSARPAGGIIELGGTLWRPVQDCRAGYGAALSFARIDRLDDRAFAQTIVQTLSPPALGGLSGLHTWNRAFGLEAIDVFGRRRG